MTCIAYPCTYTPISKYPYLIELYGNGILHDVTVLIWMELCGKTIISYFAGDHLELLEGPPGVPGPTLTTSLVVQLLAF